MKDILAGNFAASRWQLWAPQSIRVIDWNIDRGLRLPEITDFLASQRADVLILQEVDLNARRTQFRNVAEDLARKLGMNYVFGREFQELSQGSRTSPAYHGQATLSRWGLANPRIIRFRRQSGFWRPRWFLPNTEPFQERLGGRIALVTEVDLLGRRLLAYNLHLESRGNNDLRVSQLKEALDDSASYGPRVPALIAGDLNLDVSRVFPALENPSSGFRNALGARNHRTTPSKGILGHPRSIDWAFVSGPVDTAFGQVHRTVSASDHYPISFTLSFT
jgi:endonuclease/exonuclease/phosphatase family metal-dependent hydrolase